MFNFVTVDGYFAGTDGDIDWHTVDDEFNALAVDFIGQCDTALFGRTTYDLFADFWPTAINDDDLTSEDHSIAKALNDMRKIVITHNELTSDWNNTEVWHELNPEAVTALKQQDGKNIVIYGSGTIVKQLTDMGLIDEYQFIVAPVILGDGRSLFKGNDRLHLTLLESRNFNSGNALLRYVREV
jgi:dihydrofolate reductase